MNRSREKWGIVFVCGMTVARQAMVQFGPFTLVHDELSSQLGHQRVGCAMQVVQEVSGGGMNSGSRSPMPNRDDEAASCLSKFKGYLVHI